METRKVTVAVFYMKRSFDEKTQTRNERIVDIQFGMITPTFTDLMENYEIVWKGERTDVTCPDDIFAIFNGPDSGRDNPLATPIQQEVIRQRKLHTSMMVGDMVDIDGTLFLCSNTGWKVTKLNWEVS
jgi:hypothetical protein